MKEIDYRLVGTDAFHTVAVLTLTPADCASDASGVIGKAIELAAANGGGTVFLEAGEYVLEAPVTVKTSVILCGAADPTGNADPKAQTVLLMKHGRNDPDGDPGITLEACSGVRNLVFVYPEQSLSDPVPYAVTVRQHGLDSATLENVVMANPWRGIQCGPDGNELHYIKNVEITPLNIGFYIDMTTDIGRIEGLRFTPDCCAKYTGADIGDVRAYMLENTTGLFMARSDWEYVYGITAEYCAVGINITRVKDSGPNAQISSVKLENCGIGIRLVNVNPFGIALSDSVIAADIDGLEAAVKTEGTFETIMQLCGVDFIGGGYKSVIAHEGTGQLSFADCSFTGYKNGAVKCSGGGISFMRCSFDGEGGEFDFADTMGGAQILGCSFAGKDAPDLVYAGEKACPCKIDKIKYSCDIPDMPKATRGGHKKYPYPTEPEAKNFFNVLDFGAERNTDKDSSAEIQAALDAAEKAGGGIVYLPGGKYWCNSPVHIPSGVEMRGVAEVPCHTMGGGSVILSVYGKGDENAPALVTMAEKSGIRGVLFYHPEQDPATPIEYPYAVQTQGKFCYVINTVFINMWQSLDMASYPSEGHYVSYISGAPFKVGVYCGNNDGEGWVENIQFNPHYWFRSNLPNAPHSRNWQPFWFNQMKLLEALKFGYNKYEHLLGTFVFAAQHGIGFVRQDGKGTTGKFLGHGTDSGLIALYLEGAEDVEMINTQLVNIEALGRRSYIYSCPEDVGGKTGTYRIYNTLMWGDPHYAAIFDGGSITVQLMNIESPGKVGVTVNGGNAGLYGVYFARVPARCEVNGGKAELYAPVVNGRHRPDAEKFYDITENGGEITVRYEMVK